MAPLMQALLDLNTARTPDVCCPNTQVVNALLAKEADVNAYNRRYSPIQGHTKAVQALLDVASVNNGWIDSPDLGSARRPY